MFVIYCLCLDHAKSLISHLDDTAEWVDITKFLALLRQDVERYECPCPADASARKSCCYLDYS